MDCSSPGSSVHGDSPGKTTGVGCHALLGLLGQEGNSYSFFKTVCSEFLIVSSDFLVSLHLLELSSSDRMVVFALLVLLKYLVIFSGLFIS